MQVVVRNLSKRYAGVPAVEDASFEIPRGSFLTLLGPSGSGKTTTLMMIAGFVEPDEGRIEIAGRDITRLPANKRDLGVVFQSYALFPHKTVFQNVAFPLEIRGLKPSDREPRVDRLLDLVRLRALRDRSVTTLSGGQKQRVALARALVFEPPVLLMDEPLGALDKKLREEMQLEIKGLQRSLGVTAISVTHDQEEALMMSDTIAIMNEGRIVQLGTPTDLYDQPANRFVASFLGGVNLFPATLVSRSGASVLADIGDGIRVPCHAQEARGSDGLWVGIRTERVRLVAADSADAFFKATIVKQTYLGGAILHELRSQPDLGLNARIQVDAEDSVPVLGSVVGVTWKSRSAWLLS
jgi:putative spermidine/putrescine transport system ATP-binding protein